jgi:hypothetical protein
LIDNARDIEINKLQILTQQAAKDNLEEIINKPIYDINEDFWKQINEPFIHELNTLSGNC